MQRPGSNLRATKKATANAFKLSASSAPSSSSTSSLGVATSNAVPKPATTAAAVGSSPTDSFTAALATASSVAAATLANVLPDVHVNLFCLCEASGDLVFVGAKGRLCHINIHTSKPTLHDLTPTTSSDDGGVLASASHLAFNSRGTKVLVQTNQGSLYVFNLPLDAHHILTPTPDRAQVVFTDGSRRVVQVDSRSPDTRSDSSSIQRVLATLSVADRGNVSTVVPDVFEIDLRQLLLLPTVTAASATWHPLSDSHVVVLTSTDELLVYATNESTFTPEQTHVLSFPPSSSSAASTTALAFGPPTGWEAMTCYILRSTGDLFALSPVVPFESATASSALLHFLHQVTDGRLTQQQTDVDARILLKAQKHWLATVWSALPAAHVPHDPASDDDNSNDQPAFVPHVSIKSATSLDALATLKWPLQLQGPFPLGSAAWAQKGSTAQSVAAVAYPDASVNNIGRAPVLAIGWSSGHVTLNVLERDVQPRWQLKSKASSGPPSSPPPSIYVVECLNLGTTNDNGKLELTTHPLKASVIYALHATGVHVISLPWMKASPLAPPFASAVHRVLSIAPSATAVVAGASVVYSVERGHVLVVLYANGQWELINLSAKTALVGPSKGGPDPNAPSPQDVVPPLSAIVDQLQTKFVNHRLHVQGGATALRNTSIDTFKFAQDHMPALLDQVAYIEEVSAAIKSRMDVHRDWRDQQAKDAAAVAQAVDGITAATAAQRTRVESLQAKQAKLNGRAAAVLQALKENQAVLSKAEIKYKQDLHEMAHAARRLVPRVTQVNLEAQSLLRNAKVAIDATHLSADRARICHDVLTAETQLIADTTARLHDLADHVASLRLD